MSKTFQNFSARQHMTSNLFEIYWYKDNYEGNIALHHHDFYEIYFFISGTVKYIVDNKKYQLIPGDILLISPLELHQPSFSENIQCERIIIWINKSFLDSFSQRYTSISRCFDQSQPNHTNLLRLNPSIKQTLQSLIEKLFSEKDSTSYGNDILSIGYLIQIMVELNRLSLLPQQIHEDNDNSTNVISEILLYINDHYADSLSLDFVAEKFFISKYHLSHEFKRLVGTSFYRYIIQKRLVVAKQLLSTNTAPTEVYHKCGFKDYTNFYRAFKSTYGISPKEYVSIVKNSSTTNIL